MSGLKVSSGMLVDMCRMLFGTCIKGFHMDCMAGLECPKLGRKAAGSQL